MGVVYEAWDPTLERRVALKLLRSPSRRAAERLLREARALARLDHPGVVRIWAADVHRGAVYIAMELIEGQNLREWMKVQRSWAEVLAVMIGAGRGLAAAHAAGVIHRDFKPENVLVGWDGQARVLDFGIARVSMQHPDHLSYTSDGSSSTRDGEASCASEPLSGSFAGLSNPIEPIENLAADRAEGRNRNATCNHCGFELHLGERYDPQEREIHEQVQRGYAGDADAHGNREIPVRISHFASDIRGIDPAVIGKQHNRDAEADEAEETNEATRLRARWHGFRLRRRGAEEAAANQCE
jgi:serine/threonine protein kinase